MDQHGEKVSLSHQERQALADMWSNLAADDPRLARRLHGQIRPMHFWRTRHGLAMSTVAVLAAASVTAWFVA